MKITLKKSPAQGTRSESPTIAAQPPPGAAEEPGESVQPEAVAAAESAGADVGAGMDAAIAAPRPQTRAQGITALVFASLGIVAVLVFVILVGLQFSEYSFYGKPDSLWLK